MFSPVSHIRFGFVRKVAPLFYVHISGGTGWDKSGSIHVYKMAPIVSSPTEKLSRRVFVPFVPSLIKIHFSRPQEGTGNVLKNARVERNEV